MNSYAPGLSIFGIAFQAEAMREKLLKRFAAILVAGLLHASLIFFALTAGSRLHERVTAAGPTMTVYFFDARPQRPPATSPVTATRTRAAPSSPERRSEAITLPPDVPPAEMPSSAAPRIDWAEQAQHAAENALVRREAESRLRSFGLPKFSVHDKLSREHVLGDVEQFEGGETIEWINNRCYYTNRGIADFANEFGPGPKNLWLPVCKHR